MSHQLTTEPPIEITSIRVDVQLFVSIEDYSGRESHYDEQKGIRSQDMNVQNLEGNNRSAWPIIPHWIPGIWVNSEVESIVYNHDVHCFIIHSLRLERSTGEANIVVEGGYVDLE